MKVEKIFFLTKLLQAFHVYLKITPKFITEIHVVPEELRKKFHYNTLDWPGC